MKKKGSLELGVNSIVILIIAIAVLALIINFIFQKFNSLDIEPLPPDPAAAPSASTPITTAPESIMGDANKKLRMRVNVYNPTDQDVTGATISMDCSGESVPLEASTKDVPAYEYTEFIAVLTIPSKPSDLYVCTLKAAEGSNTFASQDVYLEIK